MATLIIWYFIWVIGALSLGLIVYKVFDKFLDLLKGMIDLICQNYD